MISSEVQRTLVKSPPELWAELSDPAALARHLGELGEIRIVRTEPESTVEWAAEDTTGVVSIKPSGWGTKVTLSVTRNLAGPEPADTTAESETPPEEPQSQSDLAPAAAACPAESDVDTGSAAVYDEDEPADAIVADQPEAEPVAISAGEASAPPEDEMPDTAQPEAAAAAERADEPEPRRGFFARLFSRRRRSVASAAPVASTAPVAYAEARPTDEPDAFAAVTQALTSESIAETDPFTPPAPAARAPTASLPAAPGPGTPAPATPAPATPAPATPASTAPAAPSPTAPASEALADISAELMAAEEVAPAHVTAEEVTAVLTAVLDRLGAAHHRPFSRS
jgi:hypothetical protein